MPLDLMTNMKEQLAGALIRRASVIASRWAQNYVVLGKPKPGPLTFKYHPWEMEMLDCGSDWSGRKAAQMGYSNVALCRCIYANDIEKVSVLYLLPKRNPDAADFSKSKFDAILELSPHLQNLYSNTRNIGHKQAGTVDFFIRGARSRSGLKAISAGKQVWDELDEMPKKQLSLAIERSSGYDEADRQLIKISTPTVPDFGIDAEVKRTDRSIFVFKCPSCSRYTDLPFPDCLKITTDSLSDEAALKESYIFCPLCRNKLNHAAKSDWLSLERGARWQPTQAGFNTRGFLINQYYSMTIEPWEIAQTYLKGLEDPSYAQEYWNSKGGLAHIPEGARVNQNDFVYGTHQNGTFAPPGSLVTMGTDVGKVLHVWIDHWQLPAELGGDLNMHARCRNLFHGTVDSFEQLGALQQRYQVAMNVIDWQPDERKSYEYAQKFYGKAMRCHFSRGMGGKLMTVKPDSLLVSIGRTPWLDLSQGRFKNKTILLPRDMKDEPKKHIQNLVRLVRAPKSNDSMEAEEKETMARYISVGTDHYALARLYSEVALPLAVSTAQGQDIATFL